MSHDRESHFWIGTFRYLQGNTSIKPSAFGLSRIPKEVSLKRSQHTYFPFLGVECLLNNASCFVDFSVLKTH